jgi:hypothetical protein
MAQIKKEWKEKRNKTKIANRVNQVGPYRGQVCAVTAEVGV